MNYYWRKKTFGRQGGGGVTNIVDNNTLEVLNTPFKHEEVKELVLQTLLEGSGWWYHIACFGYSHRSQQHLYIVLIPKTKNPKRATEFKPRLCHY